MADYKILDALPPGFGPATGQAPLAPPAAAAPSAPASAPGAPPAGFANPPAGEATAGSVRAPGALDYLNPSGWLGVEPGSPRALQETVMKHAPMLINPAVQMLPAVANRLGVLGKGVATGGLDYLASGLDPVAGVAGGIGGALGGVASKLTGQPARSTRNWIAHGDEIVKEAPHLAGAIRGYKENPALLTSQDTLYNVRRGSSHLFDNAMNKVEAKVGPDTILELPNLPIHTANQVGLVPAKDIAEAGSRMAVKHADVIRRLKDPNDTKAVEEFLQAVIDPKGMMGELAPVKPQGTFGQIREAIETLKAKGDTAGNRIEKMLEAHLDKYGVGEPYREAITRYRRDQRVIDNLEAMQGRRDIPGGVNRQDFPGLARTSDLIAPPPRAPAGQGGEAVRHSIGVVSPQLSHAAGLAQIGRNILGRGGGSVRPVAPPPGPVRVNLGRALGGAVSELPSISVLGREREQ